MSLHHLLLSSQNEAIEDKYTRNILYRLLHIVCEPIAAESVEYEVRSGELFYHCVYTLDSLRGCAPKELVEKSMVLWDEMLNFCADKGWGRWNGEARNVVFLIILSVARCLLLTHDMQFTVPASVLINRLQSINPQYYHRINMRFNKAVATIGEYKLATYLQEYMQSPTLLSDEIEAIIDASDILPLRQEQACNVQTKNSTKGRREKALFLNVSGEEDKERTEQEKERFLEFLHAHKLGQRQFDCTKDGSMMMIIVAFYKQWEKYGYVPAEPNGMAVYRFLSYQCERKFSVTPKSFANALRDMISENIVDPSTDMMVQEFFLS